MLLLDCLELALETAYFSSLKIGRIDASGVVQLSWALVGAVCALIAFHKEDYRYLWPITSLKFSSPAMLVR